MPHARETTWYESDERIVNIGGNDHHNYEKQYGYKKKNYIIQ